MITCESDVQMTLFWCLCNLFFNFLKVLMNSFYHQVALSSNCKNSQFLITYHLISPLNGVCPGSIIPQKIAMAETFNLRYFTSNSDRVEGGKHLLAFLFRRPWVYKIVRTLFLLFTQFTLHPFTIDAYLWKMCILSKFLYL